jgi:UDP-N-acetylmuramate dehydrogenase
MERLRKELAELLGAERVRVGEPLARHTFYRIGGPAELFVTVESAAELAAAAALARRAGVPAFVLGIGSNLLVSDQGVAGLVIENRARAVAWDESGERTRVRAEAGASLSRLSREAARRGWAGLTWACGIPGTVGGSVVQNAGAHGGSMAAVLTGVEILDQENVRRHLPAQELALGYRDSAFKKGGAKDWVILSAEMTLWREDPADLEAQIAEHDAWRRAHQPVGASCGSVFKNPPGDYAGRLIEAAGLKGLQIGGAEISTLHANFFVNTGNATAADVMALIERAQTEVMAQFGVALELEIERVGKWPT